MKIIFKNSILTLTLALGIFAALSGTNANADVPTGVNSDITDSVTVANLEASPLGRKLIAVYQLIQHDQLSQPDATDQMLALLAALNDANQYVGAVQSELPNKIPAAIQQHAAALVRWLATNSTETAAFDRLNQSDLVPALDAFLANFSR